MTEILQMMNMPDGTLRIRGLGRQRARLVDFSVESGALVGDIEPLTAQSSNSRCQISAFNQDAIDMFRSGHHGRQKGNPGDPRTPASR